MKTTPYPVKRPAERPPFSATEKAFVRRFGTKAREVRYSGRDDLVGLRLVGFKTGFIIERDFETGERFLRALEVIGNDVWRTPRKLLLRFATSEHDLVPGIRSWVR